MRRRDIFFLGSAILALVATGQARAEITPYPNSSFTLTITSGAVTETIDFTGPTAIMDDLGPSGQATDTDGNGLDQIQTQIVQMTLTGTSQVLGLGQGMMHLVASPSLGEAEEQVNGTPGILDVPPSSSVGQAVGFFDVFVELDFPGNTLHNGLPIHVMGAVSHWPPQLGDVFPLAGPSVLLLNPNDSGSRFAVTGAVYVPGASAVPEPSSLLLLVLGGAGLTLAARMQGRR